MDHNVTPCKGCSERQTACWDHCAKYAQWKTEHQKEQAWMREYKRQRREDFIRSEACKSSKRKWKVGKEHGRQ